METKPVREGGGGRGELLCCPEEMTANPHPGGHSHGSTEAAQDKGHDRGLAHAAEWPSGSV